MGAALEVQIKETGYEKGYQQNDEEAEGGERKEKAAPRDEAEPGWIGDREEENSESDDQAEGSRTGGGGGARQRPE
jgi:hypothetical protein